MSASLRLSWREPVSLSADEDRAVVETTGSRFALRRPRPEILDALRRLDPPGEDEDLLSESIVRAGGAHALSHWLYWVKKLGQRGLICRTLYMDESPLVTLVALGLRQSSMNGTCRVGPARFSERRPTMYVDGGPARAEPRLSHPTIRPSHIPDHNEESVLDRPLADCDGRHNLKSSQASYLLSRFAYLHRGGETMVVESPLAHVRIELHDPRATMLIASLAEQATVDDLAARTGLPVDAVRWFIDLLVEERMVDRTVGEAEHPAEPLDAWEFHDLLFHSRTRRGRSDAPFGGTYRLAHRPLPPAVKRMAAAETLPLYRPDLNRIERSDPPLAMVQECRRSIRKYGQQPITARQLGEFLYRVARVKDHWQGEASAPAGNVQLDLTSRPYPAGGALYELEFYVAVRACEGVTVGLYHYDPLGHGLARVEGRASDIGELLDEAAASAGIDAATLQLLFVIAARFERIAWKYESIAYALVLKHVGVVYQTMYLAATAMGLAPCAVGCGDSDLFARTSGNDYYTETSVGEFLLGSVGVS